MDFFINPENSTTIFNLFVTDNFSDTNKSSNNFQPTLFLKNLHVLSNNPTANIAQCIVGSTVLFINCAFLSILYDRRRKLQWKRYALIANMAAADILAGFALILIAAVTLACPHVDSSQLASLSGLLSVTMCTTIEGYDLLILIQYLAIRRPLWYKKLTRLRLVMAIVLTWLINTAYAIVKTYLLLTGEQWHYRNLTLYESGFLGGTCLFNTCSYGYVLYVAGSRTKQKTSTIHNPNLDAGHGHGHHNTLDQTKNVYTISSDSIPRRHQKIKYNKNNLHQNIFRQYSFLATAGLNLLVYWISILPLILSFIYAMIIGQRVYFSDSLLKHIAILLWFVRSICDPLIYTIREEKLRRNLFGKLCKKVMVVVETTQTQQGFSTETHVTIGGRRNSPVWPGPSIFLVKYDPRINK